MYVHIYYGLEIGAAVGTCQHTLLYRSSASAFEVSKEITSVGYPAEEQVVCKASELENDTVLSQ